LSVDTDKGAYHFGLNPGKFWKGELPFPVTRQKARLRMSPRSVVARVVVIGYLAYLVWRRISAN